MSEARNKSLSFGALALLLLATGWLVARTLATAPHYPTSDDGFYLKYMTEVGARGWPAIAEQFRWYLSEPTTHIYPPPSRVGFTVASAAWSKLFGASLDSLSKLSLASHLALVALQFLFARRHFGELRALAIAALTAFATLYLGLARLALTDSFITLCQVTCLWLFFELVRRPESWRLRIAFAASFAFAIFTKEISGLLALPFAALFAIERWHRHRALSLPLFATLLVAPVVVAVLGWIAAAGSVEVLVDTLRIVLLSPATNEYALHYGSGPWFRYPVDEMLASPWPTLLGLAGIALTLKRWRDGDYDALCVFFSLVYVFQIGVLSFFTKNLRYIAVLEVPLRVLAIVFVWELVASRRAALSRALLCALTAALCWLDYRSFQHFAPRDAGYDPMTFALGAARDIVPVAQPAGTSTGR